jgi:hypothetical protein
MTYHMWRLSEAGPDNLGLACTDDGLFLGGTPLIERHDGRFVVRDRDEIERLLRRGHRYIGEADRLMPGLAAVARALNAGDRCLARIAAVHLRLPDLPNPAARDAMEAEDSLIKYARDGGSLDWNPALHPRTGTPPNPGWFAPTGSESHDSPGVRVAENDDPTRRSDASSDAVENWVHLPPGKYVNDELADFVEWIANARPEDEQAIRAEIKRYYYDVGDLHGGNALTAALSRALQPGVSLEDRKFIAEWVSRYAQYDPAVFGQDTDLIYSVLGFLSPWLLAEHCRSCRQSHPKLSSRRRNLRYQQSNVLLYGSLPRPLAERSLISSYAGAICMTYLEPLMTLSIMLRSAINLST